MIDLERTCRYGHGPLRLEPEAWTLGGTQVSRDTGQRELSLRLAFTVRILVCPQCGYVELMDFAEDAR